MTMIASTNIAALVVLIVGIAATVAVVAWFLAPRKFSEDAASHAPADRSTSAEMFGDVNDRPGDPGSEAAGVRHAGDPQPGPAAPARPDLDA